jgi:hypothetical protein
MINSKNPDTSNLNSKARETDVAYLSCTHDVVTVVMKESADMCVAKMGDLLETAVELAGFKKYFVIVDARANFHSAPDVREYYSNNEYSKYRYADAFIISSLAMRLVINFYISFHKPSIPTKTFTDPERAKQWIDEMKQRLN